MEKMLQSSEGLLMENAAERQRTINGKDVAEHRRTINRKKQ